MTKPTKPHESRPSIKPAAPKKPDAELDEKALQEVSGGLRCVTGKHIPVVKITS